jgi:hypothetical protein
MQESRTTHLVSLAEICRAVSTERLGAYSTTDKGDLDSTDAVARYLWNGALCIAFHPSLHALEISLRNNLFGASSAFVATAGRKIGPYQCWLDAQPTFLYKNEEEKVQDAKARISADRRPPTAGRLVAKLGFGFWTALCRSPYDHARAGGPRLWPSLLLKVFPHLPKPQRQRQIVQQQLDDVREFRNRIAHHEPIWDRDPLARYDEILTAIGWMYPGMAKAVRVCGELEYTWHSGPERFRALAERLLGASPPSSSAS